MVLIRKRTLNLYMAVIFSLETSVFGAELACTPAKNIIHYQVQSGETISSILFNRSLSPLWGPHGYVKKVYALNKRHIKSNGQVFFGQRIRIPAGCETNGTSLVNSEIVGPLRNIAAESKSETKELVSPVAAGAVIPTQFQPVTTPAPILTPVPIPAQSPAPVAPQEPIKLKPVTLDSSPSEDSQILISLGGGYSRINSTINSNNATAVLLSKPSTAFYFRWEQNWSEAAHSFISWNNQNINFGNANRSSTVLDASQNLTELSFGGRYRLGNFGEVEMSLGSADSIFVPTYSIGSVTLEAKNLPFARIEFQRDFANVRSLSLKGGLGSTFISSSSEENYEVKPGQSYYGFIRVSQKFHHFSLFAETQYEEFQQSTSISTQNRKGLWGRLGLLWGLGK